MKTHALESQIIVLDGVPIEEFRNWLVEQAKTYGLDRLLAHHDDGVNWGLIDEDGTLVVSADVAPDAAFVPQFAAETIQQLRMFGEEAELLLWRGDKGLQGRVLKDGAAEWLDERQLLWGVTTDATDLSGFIEVSEADGLRHVVPWSSRNSAPGPRHRLHLEVRHYLAYDDDGQATIAGSRLVKLGSHQR